MFYSLLVYGDFAPLILRLVLGAAFLVHGYPKLFKNFSEFAGWLDSMGLKPGKFWALVAGVVEFFGGIAMILGVWVSLVGALVVIQMLVAMWKVKWGKVGITGENGWELDLLYLVVAAALVMMGPGLYALF